MALENIHVEEVAMDTAVNKASDVRPAIMDFERRLSGIAEMVKNVWGGQAKQAFDHKHQEITGTLGATRRTPLGISEGTSVAEQYSVQADHDASADHHGHQRHPRRLTRRDPATRSRQWPVSPDAISVKFEDLQELHDAIAEAQHDLRHEP